MNAEVMVYVFFLIYFCTEGKLKWRSKYIKLERQLHRKTLWIILCNNLFQSQEGFLSWCPLSVLTLIVLIIPVSVPIQEVLLSCYLWPNRTVVNIKNKFSCPTTAGTWCWLPSPMTVAQYIFIMQRILDPYICTTINSYVKLLIERSPGFSPSTPSSSLQPPLTLSSTFPPFSLHKRSGIQEILAKQHKTIYNKMGSLDCVYT